MAKAGRLTARKVETAGPGKYSDGGGLYLIVAPQGARKWVLRFTWRGKARELGLGSAAAVTLAKARAKAMQARQQIADGVDPIAERKRDNGVPTFLEMADRVRGSLSEGFRNAKHRQQWQNTLATYAAPLHGKPVDEITTEDVLCVLSPIWTAKPETASRVRGRIEKILNAAKAHGYRTGENPAQWRGHLDHLLPRPLKLTRGHHAALPYGDVRAFIADLRKRQAMAAVALEFAILTATRTAEALGARWSEIDLANALWTLPAERKKEGRIHRVPLNSRAMVILKEMRAAKLPGDYVFPGFKIGKPLSPSAMSNVLKRMKIDDATVHGFRSTFRDWVGDVSGFPRELGEAAMAHVIGDKAEQAYRRGDALEKRRKLMEAWAQYCEPRSGATVVPLQRGK